MSRWLLKTDPDTYSLADLQREKSTNWDGVRNAQAIIHLRAMRRGDEVLIYHTGSDKCIMGLAEVARDPGPDPNDETATMVGIKFRGTLSNPIPLADIKADKRFAKFDLVRNSRLSVMPVPDEMWPLLRERGQW